MNDTPSSPPPFPPHQPHQPNQADQPDQPGFQDFRGTPPPPPAYPPSFEYQTQVLPQQPRPVATAVPPRRGRKGFAAGVLAATLLVGGGAGLGGAAAYDALDGDDAAGQASSSGLASPVVARSDDDPAADGSVEQVAAAVLPSVVKLDVSGGEGAGSGSGIILSSDGLILTNTPVAEVAGDGGSITASFSDGSHAKATIVGTDPLTDTAVIQAEGVSGLTPATIGQSDAVDVGEEVVAIGSPFGLDATVTSGIVSALNRPVGVGSDDQGNATVYPAIQTDAAINPGNSGGPLVDLEGHVIGINSSIQSTSDGSGESGSIGLGFAIPIDEVLPVIEQMKNGDTPTHARIGVSVQDVAATGGALVVDGAQISQVGDDSAAGQAGLQDGDVITKVDDTLITGSDSLVATVRSYRPGDDVKITYERDGKEDTVTLTLDSDADPTASVTLVKRGPARDRGPASGRAHPTATGPT
ncbi:S1C family serine protease [Nocardioides sp.]|uniref:S1C family serine protease n=1 Tax=Nocardioides sp. TaxID=35761 RepID=UPI002724F613|nr:trypsin-like peptidase domain-containing protein [Nocardioides sp.]MDO9454759.1 trypsin-like peptidase domain-containing protein [Nocardioides sp.]